MEVASRQTRELENLVNRQERDKVGGGKGKENEGKGENLKPLRADASAPLGTLSQEEQGSGLTGTNTGETKSSAPPVPQSKSQPTMGKQTYHLHCPSCSHGFSPDDQYIHSIRSNLPTNNNSSTTFNPNGNDGMMSPPKQGPSRSVINTSDGSPVLISSSRSMPSSIGMSTGGNMNNWSSAGEAFSQPMTSSMSDPISNLEPQQQQSQSSHQSQTNVPLGSMDSSFRTMTNSSIDSTTSGQTNFTGLAGTPMSSVTSASSTGADPNTHINANSVSGTGDGNGSSMSAEKELQLLKAQVKDIARVCKAVAMGDLTQKVIVPVEGAIMIDLKGEWFRLDDDLKNGLHSGVVGE